MEESKNQCVQLIFFLTFAVKGHGNVSGSYKEIGVTRIYFSILRRDRARLYAFVIEPVKRKKLTT